MTEQFANIGLSLITTSLTNPRKSFNPIKLQELTESIKASGVHQPVLVRFLPGRRAPDTDRAVIYELVAGERRYRACQLAGLDTIPAMVRPLTDDQVLEIQITENLQRDDLTELEEAEGYDALMNHSNLNVDQVGAKIGKSRSYVYARLKLLDLSFECKQAMREGKIDASRALLIARIPDSKLQAKALEEACRTDYNGDQLSVRSLQTWLQKNVMLRLDNATFKITDARLVEAAGSCKDCPKRTGANPDLFADVSSADICTDPSCFHGKEDAHRSALLKMAEKKGMRIVDGKEAEEMLKNGPWSNNVEGYTPLGQRREDIAVGGETGKSLRDLLGKDAPGAILFEHPRTKELMELVPTKEAEAVLLAKGMVKADQPDAKMDAKQLEREMAHLQRMFQNEQERATEKATLDACVQAVRSTSDSAYLIGSDFLRAWLQYQLDNVDLDDMATALGYTFEDGEDEADGLTQYIRSCSYLDSCRAFVVLTLQEESRYGSDDNKLVQACISRNLGVQVKEVTAKAIKEVKARLMPAIKELQAKIDAQTAPATATTAVPAKDGQSESKPKKSSAKPAAARPVKLSAEEAISGIAAAMQGIDKGAPANATEPSTDAGGATSDALYDQAVEVVKREQKASKNLLKATLGIGQGKALMLLDLMEANGVVSAVDETRNRKVLVTA